MVGSVHNKTRDGVGGSVNLFDFVTALVITRNVFQLTCVCLVTLSVAALVIRGMVSVDPAANIPPLVTK